MDIRHPLPEHIHVLRACYNDDAPDFVALGGDHSVHVYLIYESSATLVASFHVGSRITALAWSSRSVSPSHSDQWIIELAAASADFGLHLLTRSHHINASEDIFPFGGGLSGHHGRVNDMTFCGGSTDDSAKYVATVSDDKMLMVWDLHPKVDAPALQTPTPATSPDPNPPLLQPLAWAVPFPHPLTSVNAHPSASKELIVSDSRGSIFLTDWRSETNKPSVIELVEPRALADIATGAFSNWSGSVSWRRDSVDIVGATCGPRFAIWDLAKLQGGKPTVTGMSFPEGGHRFRWCQTFPDYFAISTRSPSKGAVIHVYNYSYVQAEPTVFNIGPRPLRVQDFDFLAMKGIPRIVAVVERQLIVFYIGVD
ncbi:hypothetical protein HETIRDRAFT_309790 [Heterobasidion irregulare TC 32-1]|uniref:Uncharacterized protein n=1 Tax=Heterobasidion irregulare (strain TC 32-1) TaxID=747525 RepID=W4KI89_HETIT|nr:uncharacterized protein HETIRDRAFT_309790 [Heterobasidion irregulare TC 32-1]ETW85578.1 hypothetical protein HETIRDRAFT_309790 [Heterobasidion irregulare TC 32-1]